MLAPMVIAATLVYALIGILIFVVGFWLWDRLTPLQLWREIAEKQNVALAVLAGAVAIALAIIIGSAIHG